MYIFNDNELWGVGENPLRIRSFVSVSADEYSPSPTLGLADADPLIMQTRSCDHHKGVNSIPRQLERFIDEMPSCEKERIVDMYFDWLECI